jgi:SAM-dependent methyltransferase
MKCRHCEAQLDYVLIDLGFAPPSNAYLTREDLSGVEKYYPLKVMVCETCWLVQTQDYTDANELFTSDYAYFSSTSSTWLAHAKLYFEQITVKLNLSEKSHVVELASNDGYLLQNFVQSEIPCLGIEPTYSTAHAARALGVPVIEDFFGQSLAQKLACDGKQADLIIGNNVYAHVPDINDFTQGIKTLLKSNGVITLEFPHLLNLLELKQFDTIYHEHFSYLSLLSVQHIFGKFGLRVWHVELLTTHGGSLRVYGCHAEDKRESTQAVIELELLEKKSKLDSREAYQNLQSQAFSIKQDALEFLLSAKKSGKKVAAYGAAAKGNTLLNYSGVKADLIEFVCDAALAKQAKFMPGSHIPIAAPQQINLEQPDYIIILPWNIKEEVIKQLSFAKSWGAQFVSFIPELQVHPA